MQVDVDWQGLFQETTWPDWGHPDEEHGAIKKAHGPVKIKIIYYISYIWY